MNDMMSKSIQKSKPAPTTDTNRVFLGRVPFEQGFHFNLALGRYTGITANNMSEFAEKIKTIPVEAIAFHFQRDDYQKWFRNVIGDYELASQIDQLKKWPSWASEEDLRKALVKVVQNRLRELQVKL